MRDPAVYSTLKRGYARGDEPVHFVHNIQRYYATLRWLGDSLDSTQMRRMAGAPVRRQSPVPAVEIEQAPTQPSTMLAYEEMRRPTRLSPAPVAVAD